MRRATKRRAGVESLTSLLCEFCFEVPDNFARGLLRKVVIRSDLEAECFRCAGQSAAPGVRLKLVFAGTVPRRVPARTTSSGGAVGVPNQSPQSRKPCTPARPV